MGSVVSCRLVGGCGSNGNSVAPDLLRDTMEQYGDTKGNQQKSEKRKTPPLYHGGHFDNVNDVRTDGSFDSGFSAFTVATGNSQC